MRISDWSSDVCSSDLPVQQPVGVEGVPDVAAPIHVEGEAQLGTARADRLAVVARLLFAHAVLGSQVFDRILALRRQRRVELERLEMQFHRSEEHTSELQSLIRISYAIFCLKKK